MRSALATLAVLAVCCFPAAASALTPDPAAFGAEGDLLLQRVDQLSAQVPAGDFPVGTGDDGILRFAPGSDWTSGFWAATLWHAFDLQPTDSNAARARAATIEHFGFERTKLHDLGFMYGESSVAAWWRICGRSQIDCRRFESSGLRAAATLLRLSRTTGQGIIPMSARTCSDCPSGGTETIVDSMMNLDLLYWAALVTGESKYRALARRHADWVARHLQRSDGSTYQAGRYIRSSKRPRVIRHTHQGLSDRSVWARGQAWSIYGFADAGRQFSSRKFLAIAEKNANYVAKHLPADGLPLWDYRARASDPRDVSAGVITAAGLLHLSKACDVVHKGCAQPERWQPLANRILKGSLARLRSHSPAGFLGNQVYKRGASSAWKNDAELIFGLKYALEAIAWSRYGHI